MLKELKVIKRKYKKKKEIKSIIFYWKSTIIY